LKYTSLKFEVPTDASSINNSSEAVADVSVGIAPEVSSTWAKDAYAVTLNHLSAKIVGASDASEITVFVP